MASKTLSTGAPATEASAPPYPRIPEEAAPRGLSHIGDHVPFIMLMASLPTMPRWQLARIANRAIECIDLIDPDADIEPNGDELDGTSAEDEIGNAHLAFGGGSGSGPGCLYSDDDHGIDDLPHDDIGEAEPEEGFEADYGTDQRIAAAGHGYAAWHVDRNEPNGGGR